MSNRVGLGAASPAACVNASSKQHSLSVDISTIVGNVQLTCVDTSAGLKELIKNAEAGCVYNALYYSSSWFGEDWRSKPQRFEKEEKKGI